MVAKATAAYHFEDHTLLSSDEESLLSIRHYFKGKPKLHFLIIHGALEHSGRHQDLTQFWLKQYKDDVAVTVFDHVGHGLSGGTRAYVPSFKVYIEDLLKVGEWVQGKTSEETKIIICAHSLGGMITLMRILDPAYGWNLPITGLIFSSPCIKPRLIGGAQMEPWLAKLDRLTPKLRVPAIYRGAELTRDPERANDFDIDSLIPRFITVRMGKEIVETSHRLRGLSYYLKIPSLFLIAGDDRIVDSESTTLFAHGIDKRLTQVIQYPEHRHELWNEIDRQEIFKTMKHWVDKLLKEIS